MRSLFICIQSVNIQFLLPKMFLIFKHGFTARYARDRRVRRGENRKGKAKDNPFLCVLSELCGENLILTIAHHVYLIMAPLVISGHDMYSTLGLTDLSTTT